MSYLTNEARRQNYNFKVIPRLPKGGQRNNQKQLHLTRARITNTMISVTDSHIEYNVDTDHPGMLRGYGVDVHMWGYQTDIVYYLALK
jgi:hypothetical protein